MGVPLRVHVLAILVLLAPFAGCISPDEDDAGPGRAPAAPLDPLAIPPVDYPHDHRDPALHPGHAFGFTPLSSVRYTEGAFPAKTVLEAGNGGRMQRAGDLLFIASVRDSRAGFSIIDVGDPARPAFLGAYKSDYGLSEGEAIAATTDAAFAFTAIESSWNSEPKVPGIEVVDVSDPTTPRLSARVPTTMQPHVLAMFEADGQEYLVSTEYQFGIFPAFVAAGTVGLSAPVSATQVRVGIYAFDRSGPGLSEVSQITFSPDEIEEHVYFAHDPIVVDHPATGERVMYLASFGGGGRIVSLADVRAPRQISYTLEKGLAPIMQMHSYSPAPALVDGVLATAGTPRTDNATGPGGAYLSIYDTADPGAPLLLGQWRHPDDAFLPSDFPPLNLHIPEFTADGTRLLVPHFHAGLFVFDVSSRAAMSSPAPIAYWHPGPAFDPGARGAGLVASAVVIGDVVLAADIGSGTLHALRLDV